MSNATGGATAKARQVAGQGKEAVQQAAADVAGTAAEQAQRVGAEARDQARTITAEVRDKVGEQARAQSDRLISTIRETADHLDEMRGDRQDSPAATVVARVADGGRQFADYLDQHGPEGVLQEVQDFARRRPGAFLATALAAGFVVGRLGKSVAKADPHAGSSPAPDAHAGSSPSPEAHTGSLPPEADAGSPVSGAYAGPPVSGVAAPRPVRTPAAVRVTSPDPEPVHAGTASVLDEFTRLQHRETRP